MEGMIPIIMSRRGATVTATDAIDFVNRINYVKRAYDVEFNYLPNMPIHRFAERIFDYQSSLLGPPLDLTP